MNFLRDDIVHGAINHGNVGVCRRWVLAVADREALAFGDAAGSTHRRSRLTLRLKRDLRVQFGIMCRYERVEFVHKPCVRLLSGVSLTCHVDVYLLEVCLREHGIIEIIGRCIENIRHNRRSCFETLI